MMSIYILYKCKESFKDMEIALVGDDTNSSSASPQAIKKSIPKVTFSSLQLE